MTVCEWLSMPVESSPTPRVSTYHHVKRVFDVATSSVLLILCLPLFLVIAIMIWMDSRGPIIYAQERVGMDRRRRAGQAWSGNDRRRRRGFGRRFTIYKFRSMASDAEKVSGPVWAQERDPRATRVGAFLRRTHLDELPQLISVLRGDMSLVGPRPERPQLVHKLVAQVPTYALRSHALPGITGLAQIKNGYDQSLDTVIRKVKYDVYYIRHCDMLMDLKIIALTAQSLVHGKEGYRATPQLPRRTKKWFDSRPPAPTPLTQ